MRQYQAYPERLYDVVKGMTDKTIIIDEIQKAPELLNAVHSLIDDKKAYSLY